jgi:hypothetical protein
MSQSKIFRRQTATGRQHNGECKAPQNRNDLLQFKRSRILEEAYLSTLFANKLLSIFGLKRNFMAKLILEIENSKLKFFKELIRNFSFVRIADDPMPEDTDEQIRENVKLGVEELKLVVEGKKKSRLATEFLEEL